MKKSLLVLIMSVIMIGLASCGGNDHSKAFNKAKKIMDNISDNIKSAKTCDDVDMAAFGILGMLGIEGIDALSAEEQAELDKMSEEMNKLMESKKAELDCKDSFFDFDDEDVPLDEPVEEEVE